MIHNLVKRSRDVAMYTTETDEGDIIGYEVFIIREQKEKIRNIRGQEIKLEHKELFPRNEDFGYIAYAPRTLEKAEYHFKTLKERIEMRRKGICLN